MMEEFRIDALYVRQSIDKKESISIESQLDFCKYETRGEAYEEYVDRGLRVEKLRELSYISWTE